MLKKIFWCAAAASATIGFSAAAQDTLDVDVDTGRDAAVTDASTTRDDARRFSGVRDLAHPQFTTIAVGPAMTTGLDTDEAMLNLSAAVNYNMAENISGKIFGDANLGTNDDSARFLNFGLGADFYPTARRPWGSQPFITGNAGFGMTRNSEDNTENALALGLGGGMRFAARAMDWEAGVHYTVLTAQNDEGTPTALALRAGVNF